MGGLEEEVVSDSLGSMMVMEEERPAELVAGNVVSGGRDVEGTKSWNEESAPRVADNFMGLSCELEKVGQQIGSGLNLFSQPN